MKDLIDKFREKRLKKENTEKLLNEEMLDDKRKIIELQDKIISLYENKDKLEKKNKEHLDEIKQLREKKVKKGKTNG